MQEPRRQSVNARERGCVFRRVHVAACHEWSLLRNSRGHGTFNEMCKRRERERESVTRGGSGGGRAAEGSMWFGRVDAPPSATTSTAVETTFRRQLQRRGWRGWFYWSRLTTPSTPSHHAYAPLPPSRGTRARWCIRGCTTPSTSLASTLPYHETRGSTRWLIEFDKSWRRSSSSSSWLILVKILVEPVFTFIMARKGWMRKFEIRAAKDEKKIFG